MTVLALLLVACGGDGSADEPETPLAVAEELELRPLDASLVARGMELYSASCASCHGASGEGQPNWRERDADGLLPAPPHDGSGHTWHHSDGLLFRIVRDGCASYSGSAPCGMPGFGEQLTDDEIIAVIEYMRSWWGPEERAFQDQVTRNDPLDAPR